MSARRPLQSMPALAAANNDNKVLSTRFGRGSNTATTSTTTKTTTTRTATNQAANGILDMADDVQEGVEHDTGSMASVLSSLEGDDEFERLLIQNARDERRLQAARRGGYAQPFRKARTHARVGLTMDNLERNDAANNNSNNNSSSSSAFAATARGVALQSPPSSSGGSIPSDPAMRAPAGWGRKGRTSRDWLKSIARDDQRHDHHMQEHHTQQQQHDMAPLSPLSHKSFVQGQGQGHQSHHDRNDSSGEWDLTFDMNEASMLVSTPYVPRNTKLDDIRAREMESLRETGLAAARLDNARKSPQTIPVVERHVPANAANAARPAATPSSNRRTDSQDLLRRLARASNTPSPKESRPARPHSYPHPQPDPMPQLHSPPPTESQATPAPNTSTPPTTSTQQEQPQPNQPHTSLHDGTTAPKPSSVPTPEDVDATPLPVEPSVLQPKTPAVMGAWVDTPGPRTLKRAEPSREPLPSPKRPTSKGLSPKLSKSPERRPSKHSAPEGTQAPTKALHPAQQVAKPLQPSPPRPRLPGSALHALVQEARANHDYGDDTLHSLEDLMITPVDNEVEEDTLQGLELPTSAPRSEAERERHAEVENLHRLRQHLRSTSTSIRDASRGLTRVGSTVEHIQVESTGERVPVLVHDFSRDLSLWPWLRSFFWDERLKTQREVKNAPLRIWGGVTLLGILLTLSFIWWASETVACEMFCHPEYASYSPYPFAVNMDAPKRGVVIPTLVYRALFKTWTTPLISPIAWLSSWTWASLWTLASGVKATGLGRPWHEAATNGGPVLAVHTEASRIQEETHEEDSWEWSMAEDEVLRR